MTIETFELDDHRERYTLKKNFTVISPFKIQQFSDSWQNLLPKEKDNAQLCESNRTWSQDANNIFNLRRLCNELLLPIQKITNNKIEIVCGILNNELCKLLQLPKYSQLRYGKAVILKTQDSFDTFLKILISELKFSECIYFRTTDCIYIGLPSEVLKDIVKVK